MDAGTDVSQQQTGASRFLSVSRKNAENPEGLMDVENARTEAHETRHHEGCAYRSEHRQDVRRTRMLLKP